MSIQTQQGSLVIVDPHTDNPSVFFKGNRIDSIEMIKISWDLETDKVMLVVKDSELASSMKDCGIKVRVAV